MRKINQSHRKSSPELMAIVNAKRNGKPFMIDGLPYTLDEWQPKESRIFITLVPFGFENVRKK